MRGGLRKAERVPRPLAPTHLAGAMQEPRHLPGGLSIGRQFSVSSGGTIGATASALRQLCPWRAQNAILPDREASSRPYHDGPKVAALLPSP